jgi:hypothetical protein
LPLSVAAPKRDPQPQFFVDDAQVFVDDRDPLRRWTLGDILLAPRIFLRVLFQMTSPWYVVRANTLRTVLGLHPLVGRRPFGSL